MFTQPFHDFHTHNAILSEDEDLAAVVEAFPQTPRQTRDNKNFPYLMPQGEARLRLAHSPSPGAAARRMGRKKVEGATPIFLPLVRHRGGLAVSLHSSRLTRPFGGRSLHSDPWREG